MLKIFRMLSLVEGLSLITLLFIAMPAKYQFGYGEAIFYVGMTHGILWTAYFMLSLMVSHKQGWTVVFWMFVLFASVAPFACFFLDKKLKDELVPVRVQP